MATTTETAKIEDTPTGAQILLSHEVESTIMPLLKKLKEPNADPLHTAQLINILESNLQHLVKAYDHSASLTVTYQRLTPVEALVASMIRQGLSTKVIAETLTIASGTVSIHRKHIRKKLGLDSKAINLHSYLLSLAE